MARIILTTRFSHSSIFKASFAERKIVRDLLADNGADSNFFIERDDEGNTYKYRMSTRKND